MTAKLPVLLTVVVALLAARPAAPAQDVLDPTFAKVSLENWLTDRDQARFQWNVRTSGGELGELQRLRARVEVTVDGNEVAKRRGRGELVLFVQFSDSDHRRYQTHGSIQLDQANDAAAKSDFVFVENALAVPGDYRVIVGILDTHTGEHAALERAVRVGTIKNDPLPECWQDLPAVEFTEAADPPDAWFQPHLTGRLHLPLETRHDTRVEVLLNASPSALGPRYRTGQLSNRSMADLLPSLKVLSDVDLKTGALGVTLFDLTRRQVLFSQDRVSVRDQPLDWPRLRDALLEANPNKIDVHELTDHEQNAQFFVEEVRRRITAVPPPAILIILSGPMSFPHGADMRPIELPGRQSVKVFYVRYHPPPMRMAVASSQVLHGRRRGFEQSQNQLATQEPLDALQPLLKPLDPHVFEVYDPGQFRKALAEMMKEIGRM
jgi:hypothetical protein